MKEAQITQPLIMLEPIRYEFDHWIGRCVGDRQRYHLKQCLGVGNMAYVFLARDTVLGKLVALKLLKEILATGPQWPQLRQRFENEVKVCAAIESDRIVAVSDYDETDEGLPFYVMEYLRGQSLRQLLHKQHQLPVDRTVNIINQVCDGLSSVHEGITVSVSHTVSQRIDVVHRDLKPDNIFLVSTVPGDGDSVKILDFGIAKISENQEGKQLTTIKTFMGTYRYAAPEQLKGANIDKRADIYSLGIILYEMLSGTNPFGLGLDTNAITDTDWILAHIQKPVQPLRSQPGLSNLSPLLEQVVLKCLEKSPSDRFDTVDNLKIALKVATRPNPVSPSILSKHNSENKTTVRPLTPLPQPLCDRTSKPPVEFVDLEDYHTVLLLGKDSLVELLTEIIGPIAPALVEEKAAQASSTKELVNKLLPYLSSSQRIKFNKRAMLTHILHLAI